MRHHSPQAREEKRKYVQQLTDIENLCKQYVPADTMSTMSAELLATKIIEMIHAPWRSNG
jgi:hypothetical protein